MFSLLGEFVDVYEMVTSCQFPPTFSYIFSASPPSPQHNPPLLSSQERESLKKRSSVKGKTKSMTNYDLDCNAKMKKENV